MEITEEEFDALVRHTLRIEMLSGMVLIYRISPVEKQRVIGKLRSRSEGIEQGNPLIYLYFDTCLNRSVMVRVSEIVRIIFCFDPVTEVVDPNAYYDNFKVLEKDTNLVEESTPEGKVALKVVTEEFLPSAIICHKGVAADDGYDSNPMLYYDLAPGCLDTFNIELDDESLPMRQFIDLMDMDGEANFILLNQVVIMEFENALFIDFEALEREDGEEEDSVVQNTIITNLFDDLPWPEDENPPENQQDILPF